MNKLLFTAFVWQLTVADRVADKIKTRREAGQGTLEYVGVIAVAAIIVIALITAASNFKMDKLVTDAIKAVTTAAGFGA